MLVGPPGCGKSTLAQKYIDQGWHYVSTDLHLEKLMSEQGLTYATMNEPKFHELMKDATRTMKNRLAGAIANKENIVWDQTNITIKARAGKLQQLKGYDITAITYEIPYEVLWKRLRTRENSVGKVIPPRVVLQMAQAYQRPTVDEGFSAVYVITE